MALSSAAELPSPREPGAPYWVFLVCLGNICRSPMGERVLAAEVAEAGLAGKVVVDSAGTGDWHVGEAMDHRAKAELARRGHDAERHEARQIKPGWLDDYDLLLAVDRSSLARLTAMSDGSSVLGGRIRLLRDFDPAAPDGAEVPDPYDGQQEDFAEVFDLVDAAAKGLVGHLADLL